MDENRMGNYNREKSSPSAKQLLRQLREMKTLFRRERDTVRKNIALLTANMGEFAVAIDAALEKTKGSLEELRAYRKAMERRSDRK